MKRFFYSILVLMMMSLVSCEEEEIIIVLTDLAIEPDHVELAKGGETELKVVFTPDNVPDKTVFWESSNDEVVTVDYQGKVVAKNAGSAVVTAVSNGIMAKCDVTVKEDALESIALDLTELSLKPEETAQLTATVTPSGIDYGKPVWKSSDAAVATVTEKGLVTAVNPGMAEITVSLGSVSAKCAVEVIRPAAFGDYFYSDGTYSAELAADKTPVGIVYWVGDPTVNDPTLKKDHPDCVNGLVLALTESNSKFQPDNSKYYKETKMRHIQEWLDTKDFDYVNLYSGSSAGDNGNKILGYNNTRAMMEFNAAEENAEWKLMPIENIEVYAQEFPLPENTSGWYLPSIKEIVIMSEGDTRENVFYQEFAFSQFEALNNILATIEGTIPLVGGKKTYYWSSTEHTSSGFYYFNAKFYMKLGGNPLTSDNAVRYVFAF